MQMSWALSAAGGAPKTGQVTSLACEISEMSVSSSPIRCDVSQSRYEIAGKLPAKAG